MKLLRDTYLASGIFGQLLTDDGSVFCQTLEHAYIESTNPDPFYIPKMAAGIYTCVRRYSPHFGYDVFQITNVPNCTFIEIHRGNIEENSEGCVLLGLIRQGAIEVLQSKDAFNKFMKLMDGVNSFQLTVV